MPLITKLTMELIEMRLGDQEVVHGEPSMDTAISTVDEISESSSRTLPNMKMGKGQRSVLSNALS